MARIHCSYYDRGINRQIVASFDGSSLAAVSAMADLSSSLASNPH
jgi:hypothetical protein